MESVRSLALVGSLALIGLASTAPAAAQSRQPEEPVVPWAKSLWSAEQQVKYFPRRAEIFPVRVIPTGDHVYHLPVAVHQISPRWTWNGKAMDVDTYMEAHRTSGVIVLKDGQILLERYGLGRTDEDVWESASVGKSVTALLLGAAIQDGYIGSMDDPLTQYIPDLKGGVFDGVTIRQLVTMSSGVAWDDDYRTPDGNGSRIAIWPYAKEDPVAYMSRLPRANSPGAEFVYSSGDTFMAGILISKATGKSLSAYLGEKIWKPFGMEHEAYWLVTPSGYELGDGAIQIALRDYARIGQFVLEGGEAGGVQVLPPDWLMDAVSAQVTFPPDSSRSSSGYGYYWWIYKDAFAASGAAGQRIHVFPKDKVVIAVNSAFHDSTRNHGQALQAFVKVLHKAAVEQTLRGGPT